MSQKDTSSLDKQRAEFKRRRFLAMPLAGSIVWTLVGIAGALLTPFAAVIVLFIATGSTFYIAVLISRFTGEHLFDHKTPKNTFDSLFLSVMAMALMVFAIAIPFFLRDRTSLPLTVGILTGLMWVPFSWIIEHWVGLMHGVSRTLLIVGAWYLFPDQCFVVIPLVIVAVYLLTIFILEQRWREVNDAQHGVAPNCRDKAVAVSELGH